MIPDVKCGICLDDWSEKDAYPLSCRHSFHKDCALAEQESKGALQCPTCRRKVSRIHVPFDQRLCSSWKRGSEIGSMVIPNHLLLYTALGFYCYGMYYATDGNNRKDFLLGTGFYIIDVQDDIARTATAIANNAFSAIGTPAAIASTASSYIGFVTPVIVGYFGAVYATACPTFLSQRILNLDAETAGTLTRVASLISIYAGGLLVPASVAPASLIRDNVAGVIIGTTVISGDDSVINVVKRCLFGMTAGPVVFSSIANASLTLFGIGLWASTTRPIKTFSGVIGGLAGVGKEIGLSLIQRR